MSQSEKVMMDHRERSVYFMTLSAILITLSILFLIEHFVWWANIPICLALGLIFLRAARYEKAGVSL